MYEYAAYGLGIRSAFRLPELRTRNAGTADVVVEQGTVEPVPPGPHRGDGRRRVTAEPGRCRVTYDGIVSVRIEDGSRIVADPVSEAAPARPVFRRLLGGQVLGIACHQRGALVLHGSAVGRGADAAVFLGAPGAGKSTTAAACHQRGFSLYDDDVVVVRFVDGAPTVAPGVPQLALDLETAAALGFDANHAAGIDDAADVAYHRISSRRRTAPAAPSRCYVLTAGDTVAIEPIPPQEALLRLVGSTYTAGMLADTDAADSNFEQCSRLLESVPLQSLSRPADLGRLSDIADAVEKDFPD
jgi:hypothetical protein